MSNSNQPILEVEQVSYVYPARQGRAASPALSEVNLRINPGELVMLKGESGCGKTTLLTLIGALRSLQPGRGSITLRLGRDNPQELSLGSQNEEGLQTIRRSIGFIFQRHNLLTSLTALQNVCMALQLHGRTGPRDIHRASRLLKCLGLGKALHSLPSQLSGGQSQRVAIARALITHPQFILADEPTAALDPSWGKRILRLLRRRAKREKMTCLIVTHDESIRDQADRIVEMDKVEEEQDVNGLVVKVNKGGIIKNNIIVAERKFILDSLRTCPAFAPLLPSKQLEITNAISICQPPDKILLPEEQIKSETFRSYRPGENICWPGDPADAFFLIRRGVVEVRSADDAYRIATLPDDHCRFFGDQAVVRNSQRNAIVRALTDVEVYIIQKERWLKDDIQSLRIAVEKTLAVYNLKPPPNPESDI